MKTLFSHYLLVLISLFGCSLQGSFHTRNESVDIEKAISNLDRHISLLEQFNTKNKHLKLLSYKTAGNRFMFIDEVLEFSHDLLRIAVKKMLNDESLDPLFVIWRLFVTEYKDIECDVFIQEMALLLFSIYKNMFVAFLNNRTPQDRSGIDCALLQEIVDIYNVVQKMPIAELLKVLDKCLDQFVVIMEKYGMTEDEGWIAWLKKYWWLPPVVTTSIVVSIVQHLV